MSKWVWLNISLFAAISIVALHKFGSEVVNDLTIMGSSSIGEIVFVGRELTLLIATGSRGNALGSVVATIGGVKATLKELEYSRERWNNSKLYALEIKSSKQGRKVRTIREVEKLEKLVSNP